MIRMACDCVLVMDKQAGYSDLKVQDRLIEKYAVYFAFNWNDMLRMFATDCFSQRIRECNKSSHKMFLLRCKNAWIR